VGGDGLVGGNSATGHPCPQSSGCLHVKHTLMKWFKKESLPVLQGLVFW
jgi:hypothetical protein